LLRSSSLCNDGKEGVVKRHRPQRNLVERETAKHVDPRLANELLVLGLRLTK
jgi:hypothetical protein